MLTSVLALCMKCAIKIHFPCLALRLIDTDNKQESDLWPCAYLHLYVCPCFSVMSRWASVLRVLRFLPGRERVFEVQPKKEQSFLLEASFNPTSQSGVRQWSQLFVLQTAGFVLAWKWWWLWLFSWNLKDWMNMPCLSLEGELNGLLLIPLTGHHYRSEKAARAGKSQEKSPQVRQSLTSFFFLFSL